MITTCGFQVVIDHQSVKGNIGMWIHFTIKDFTGMNRLHDWLN